MITIVVNQRTYQLTPATLAAALQAALDAGATAAYSLMQRYPPPRGAYRRTGNLRQKLSIIKRAPQERAVVNTASYAQWVYGPRQAWMHVGRWANVTDARAAAQREAVDTLTELIGRQANE